MAPVSIASQQQWAFWIQANIARPFRRRSLQMAIVALVAGATAEQAAAAAKQAERNQSHRANSRATAALVGGALAASTGLFIGGLSILGTLFALASGIDGTRSVERQWQAWTGIGLGVLGLALFILRLELGDTFRPPL